MFLGITVVCSLLGAVSSIAGAVYLSGSSPSFPGATTLAVNSKGVVFTAENTLDIVRMTAAGTICSVLIDCLWLLTTCALLKSGVTSTLAGSGVNSFLDGIGSAATFYSLQGIAVDTNDMLYVTDSNSIRRITSSGEADQCF